MIHWFYSPFPLKFDKVCALPVVMIVHYLTNLEIQITHDKKKKKNKCQTCIERIMNQQYTETRYTCILQMTIYKYISTMFENSIIFTELKSNILQITFNE